MPTYAPAHRIFWLPLKLFRSDGFVRELEMLFKDTGTTGNINAVIIEQFATDLTNDTFNIDTRKSLDPPLTPGSFSLSLVDSRRPSYTDIIQPNDLILIQINGGEQNGKFHNVMLGLVVRVAKSTSISGDRVDHHVEISGQDMTRWLYSARVFFWFYAGIGRKAKDGVEELAKRQQAFDNYFPNQGRSELGSAAILENILTGYIGVFFPRVKEIFRWNPVPTRSVEAKFLGDDPILGFGEKYIPNVSLDAYEGSFANLLLDHQLEYLAELWSDTTPSGGFTINYRRVPFDESDWYSFAINGSERTRLHHVIPDDAIVSSNFGRSDQEYYNFISTLPWIYAANTSIQRLVMDGKRLDLSSIKDRGVRPLLLSNKYLDRQVSADSLIATMQDSFSDALKNGSVTFEPVNPSVSLLQLESSVQEVRNKTSSVSAIADDWASTLWRWYSQLDRYYSGHLRINGSPAIRVGHKVALPATTRQVFSQTMHFYVVGVSHSYNVERGSFVTDLELTRGQPQESFIRPVTDGLEDEGAAEAAKEAAVLKNDRPLDAEPFGIDISIRYGTGREFPD